MIISATDYFFAGFVFFHAFIDIFRNKPFYIYKKENPVTWNTGRALTGLDPDQDRRFVGPDLGPNCFQKLPADNKIRYKQGMN